MHRTHEPYVGVGKCCSFSKWTTELLSAPSKPTWHLHRILKTTIKLQFSSAQAMPFSYSLCAFVNSHSKRTIAAIYYNRYYKNAQLLPSLSKIYIFQNQMIIVITRATQPQYAICHPIIQLDQLYSFQKHFQSAWKRNQ